MSDGPWTKFQDTQAQDAGPWSKFAEPSKEIEPPDAVAQSKERLKAIIRPVSPLPLPGENNVPPERQIESSPYKENKFEEIAAGPGKQLQKDFRTGAYSLIGAGIGGGLAEGLVPGAKAAAGGSKLLKFLLPAMARGSGAGAGAGAGTLAGGGTPKEALGTAATFTGAEIGGEALVKGGSKASKFVKELTKSKVTQLEEAHAAEVAKAKAVYEEEVQAHKQKMMQVQQQHQQQSVESDAQHQRDVEYYKQGLKQAEQEHKQQLTDMEAAHAKNIEAHKQQIQATAQMEEQKAAQAEAEYQKELRTHQAKVADLNKNYEAKVAKFKDAESIRAQQKELGTTVGENVKLADKNISKKLGDDFQAVNEAVEKKGPTAKPTDATKLARSEILFPDSLETFNGIMKNLGENPKGGEFANMRASYTKLNDILYGGSELPSDLYKAVKIVRDTLGKDLRSAAESVGMGERYSGAMKKWAEYIDDWHDTSSLAKGGSPIARLLTAEDPQYVVDQFGGKSADRLIKTLEKYKGYGVNTELAGNLKDATSRLKSMSVPKEMPGAPTLQTQPERAASPTFTKIPTPPIAPSGPSSVAIPRAPQAQAPPSSVTIPQAPQAPQIPPFNRKEAERKYLIDLIRKALLVGGGGAASAYGFEKLFGGKGSSPVP